MRTFALKLKVLKQPRALCAEEIRHAVRKDSSETSKNSLDTPDIHIQKL